MRRFIHSKKLGIDPPLAIIEVALEDRQILFRKPYSHHPKDNYLEVVLAWWHNKFVTWVQNHDAGGFNDGHYFAEEDDTCFQANFLEALKDYDKRGKVKTETARIYRHNAGL